MQIWSYNLGQEFEQIVKRFPGRSALKFKDSEISYADLNAYANRLGRYLLSQGIKSGDRICITSKKTVTTYALFISCLKLGVAYSVLDRFSPFARLEKMLNTCRPRFVIADRDFYETELKGKPDTPILFLEVLSELVESIDGENLEETSRVSPESIAYIMFTSGSTGFPKGVAISHQNVIQFKNWGIEEYSISERDVLTNVNALFFDNSVFDFYMSMFSGACLLPLCRADLKDPGYVVEYINQKRATLWFSVPSLIVYLLNLRALQKDSFKNIRMVVFGGEGFPKKKLKELFDLFGDRIQLVNVYGPTECTCICSSYLISSDDFEGPDAMEMLAPLGRGMCKNFSYAILNDQLKQVNPGEIGELYLGGLNVGSGYFGNREETRKSFIQNPLNHDTREIVYKTGDLVRQDPDSGKVFFCGRKDHQVKFMGYRIELGEIESVLNGIELVNECALTYGKKNGYDEITSFVVSSLSGEEIKARLTKKIPPYMIPRKIVNMDSLPKNMNGKIDRKKLSEEYYDKTGN